jgi:hypothetical protein
LGGKLESNAVFNNDKYKSFKAISESLLPNGREKKRENLINAEMAVHLMSADIKSQINVPPKNSGPLKLFNRTFDLAANEKINKQPGNIDNENSAKELSQNLQKNDQIKKADISKKTFLKNGTHLNTVKNKSGKPVAVNLKKNTLSLKRDFENINGPIIQKIPVANGPKKKNINMGLKSSMGPIITSQLNYEKATIKSMLASTRAVDDKNDNLLKGQPKVSDLIKTDKNMGPKSTNAPTGTNQITNENSTSKFTLNSFTAFENMNEYLSRDWRTGKLTKPGEKITVEKNDNVLRQGTFPKTGVENVGHTMVGIQNQDSLAHKNSNFFTEQNLKQFSKTENKSKNSQGTISKNAVQTNQILSNPTVINTQPTSAQHPSLNLVNTLRGPVLEMFREIEHSGKSLAVKINVENLGQLNIKVNKGIENINILIQTSSLTTREIIEKVLPQLQSSLQIQQNTHVEMNVTYQDSREDNFDNNRFLDKERERFTKGNPQQFDEVPVDEENEIFHRKYAWSSYEVVA